ncbi:MAG: hydrogenase expression/formation protein HypE [Methanosarcinaceae archaeon]|nr:hydrogenase expression/formation protein HypE [Methanosarcinaceae archaeon]
MDSKTITLEHGAGGEVMQALIGEIILKNFRNKSAGSVGLESLDDGSTVKLENFNSNSELVLTTDSHVISPVFFPDTNIGRLAVSGTINDLTVMGARPLALTCAVIVPEGFPLADFEKIIKTMDETASEAGVPIITGDTKTLEKSALDSIILNTAGLGITDHPVRDCGLRPGDSVLVTGTIGDHGISLIAHREGFDFDTDLVSDSAPLWKLVEPLLSLKTPEGEPVITAMKDPTRGGLANALNEMAQKAGVGILLEEANIPFKPAVSAACEMLGLDPLEVANEGKAIIGVKAGFEEKVLEILRQHPYGKDAALIGEVTAENEGDVMLRTGLGGMRYVDVPAGDPIPRVC